MDAEQIARNDAVFRAANERIERAGVEAQVAEPLPFICECERTDCQEQIEVTLEEYERIRSHRALFVIRPGHEAPDFESVVERHESYWVMRKHEGEPAEFARRIEEQA